MSSNPAFEDAIRDIWIAEIRAHTSVEALKRWAQERARQIASSEYVEELRRAYFEKMKEIGGNRDNP